MARKQHANTAGTVRAHLDVPGGRLAYETAGAGSPVLFVHSVIADSRMWDREVSVYSSTHRTIRFDLRGFGGSAPATAAFSYLDDLRALLDHLRVDRPFVVGSSAGGAIALDFALANPDMVRGLLLAAPGPAGGALQPPFDAEEKAAFDYDDQKSQAISLAWSKKEAATAFDLLRQLWCSQLGGSSLELFRTMVEQNATEAFENRSMKLATDPPPVPGGLAAFRVPTTILVGDRDNPSSPVIAKRIARAVTGARLVSVAGADHLVNLSRPDDFDRELRAALASPG